MWRIGLAFALICAACASAPQPLPINCDAPAGAASIWADARTRYVVLGEHHGTSEMPAMAAELVCEAARDGAQVLVALEFPRYEEASLQAFVAGALDGAAMLEHSRFWQRNNDGRASAAMFSMLERLRALRQAGLNINVISTLRAAALNHEQERALLERFPLAPEIDRRGSLSDLHMAASIIDGAHRLGARRVIFLVGNAHAKIAPSRSGSLNPTTGDVREFIRMHAAAALPRESTLSLFFTHAGGAGYARTRERAGVDALRPSERELSHPGVVIAPYLPEAPEYDGRIFIGPVSASAPARQVEE